MTRLLHIQCSPRLHRSASLEIARSFIQRYQQQVPDTQVSTLDLWSLELPELDQTAMDAKYARLGGQPLNASEQSAWDRLQELAAPLHQADLLVFSVPLWNFSIPYKLKHFIDLVSHQGILFSFDPEHGLQGLLRNKTAVVSYARGLDFSAQSNTPAQAFDFQKPYIEAWLNFIGIADQHSLVVEKTILGPDIDQASRQATARQAHGLAEQLAARRP
ncbi:MULTISPECIES: NAD(P)H-dependent oxidoreductase [unclassified Pseudomonas]|uniref:FMN-dependent NADH-azoreductase n=1 Tax=unclassified Pseudomonas TaxID=196821 RepID=UPI001A9EE4D8|nr:MULTISPECIES: NAD(P)H-dependent oxidoreductase [unclassified Pseudomonas]MDP4567840.1 NAD(P)H-dependent oxidoreductase [Pseudomonas sp. LPH60]